MNNPVGYLGPDRALSTAPFLTLGVIMNCGGGCLSVHFAETSREVAGGGRGFGLVHP